MLKYNLKFIFLFALSLASTYAFAISDKKLFSEAVDQFKLTTIKYVLASDKNNDAAVKLSQNLEAVGATHYDLINEIRKAYNGTKSKTEVLADSIEFKKRTFNPSQTLNVQLDEVIGFILLNRKGKPYLSQLHQELNTLRDDILLTNKTASGDVASANTSISDDLNPRLSKLEQEVKFLRTDLSKVQTASTSPFVIVALVLLGALSIYNTWLIKQQGKSTRRSDPNGSNQLTNKEGSEFAIYSKIDDVNRNLEHKIDKLKQELRQQKGDSPKQSHGQGPVQNPATNQGQPIQPYAKRQNLVSQSDGNVAKQGNKEGIKPKPQPAAQPVIRRYADYPREGGFTASQLTETTDRRSIYEIVIKPGSEFASFTIINDKSLHEYAIQNRERLLKDACDFDISSSRHTQIVVTEPGTLKKNANNVWEIHKKALIKFV